MNFTEWHAWIASWVAWITGAIVTLSSYGAGIWLNSGKFGLTGLMFMFVCIFSLIPLSLWTIDNRPARPEKLERLPRAERKQLKKEQARILLDRKIEDLEYEHSIGRGR